MSADVLTLIPGYDAADYTNVNQVSTIVKVLNFSLSSCKAKLIRGCTKIFSFLCQCMKFMAKTTMNTATFRDITLATSQGTLVDKPLSGYRVTKKRRRGFFLTYLYLFGATYLFFYAILKFLKIRREKNFAPQWDIKEPLGVFT